MTDSDVSGLDKSLNDFSWWSAEDVPEDRKLLYSGDTTVKTIIISKLMILYRLQQIN